MYILSIPSFTWIHVTQGGDHVPSGRSGHTCTLRDGQIVLVGGYTASNTTCDSPGVYVFNASSLSWEQRFTALSHAADWHPDNNVLANSFGYVVPQAVASVIGGGPQGSATITTPAAGPATAGPFATGKPPVFTITASGSTATITQWGPSATGGAGGNATGVPSSGSSSSSNDYRRPSLIAAGVIAGAAGLIAMYLGYCAWLYRRQVRAYKMHLAVANRYSATTGSRGSFGGLAAFFGGRKSSKRSEKAPAGVGGADGADTEKLVAAEPTSGRHHQRHESTSTTDSLAWTHGGNPTVEPLLLFDDATPESGFSSSGSPALRPPARPARYPQVGAWNSSATVGAGSSSAATPGSTGAIAGEKPKRSGSGASSSADEWLDGQEPSFFSVVMGPRRALRVVNGLEGDFEATN
jgi:hypothetical protein